MKKLLSSLLTVVMLLTMVPANALFVSAATYSGTTGDCTWTLEDDLLTITGSGSMGYYSSTNTAPWYDYAPSIKRVVVSDGVTVGGNYAFFGCSNLESITLPYIGIRKDMPTGGYQLPLGYVFGETSYENSTATLQRYAQKGDDSGTYTFDTFYIPNGLTTVVVTGGEISYGAFDKCSNLTSVTLSNDITSIGSYAFYGCTGLKEVNLPDSVTTIGAYAFYNCSSVTSFTVPKQTTSIGSNAFYGCENLTDVIITDPNAWCKLHFGNSSASPTYYAENVHVLDSDGKEASAIVLDDTVTTIPARAFLNCTSLNSVTIGSHVESIGDHAFKGCAGLKTIEILGHVTTIGHYAFINCSALTTAVIGANVTTIGEGAFANCSNLIRVVLGRNVSEILIGAFERCAALKNVRYVGTRANRDNINIDDWDGMNDPLINATWTYGYICSSHRYSNVCDNTCDVCDFARDAHSFTDAGDAICNECGYQRQLLHNSNSHTNGVCDFCGQTHRSTVPDGYIGIYTKTDLNAVRNNLSGNYILMNDIRFSNQDFAPGGAFYNSGKGFTPIGTTSSMCFSGVFDGNGFSISNLYIFYNADGYCGLFGYNKGTIRNLGLINGSIEQGDAPYSASVGGIAGLNDGVISNCYNTNRVEVFNTDSNQASASAGGIAGTNYETIENCYNIGQVSAETRAYFNVVVWAGGICGYNGGTVTNCYNTGKVYGETVMLGNSEYNTCLVGGICGPNSSGTITNAYYMSNTSKGVGNGTDNTQKCTAATMCQASTFVGFDFENVWTFIESPVKYTYPILKSAPYVEKEDVERFAGGYGTEEFPYLIATKQQLDKVNTDLEAHYKLVCDIDLTNDSFTPIGRSTYFRGVFDGDGHTIKNIQLSSSASGRYTNYGLFSYISGTVKNLGVVNITADVTYSVNDNPRVLYVYVGGIAAHNGGTIINCYAGGNMYAHISGSTTTSLLPLRAGGVVGYNAGTITGCYNMSTVNASSSAGYYGDTYVFAGGIVGDNQGDVTDCYNTGSVFACAGTSIDAGSVAGRNYYGGHLTNVYSTPYATVYYCNGSEHRSVTGDDYGTINGEYNASDSKETYKTFDFDHVWDIDSFAAYPYPTLRANPMIGQTYVTGIEIIEQPNKTVYLEGAALDPNGLVIKLYYDDGKTVTTSNCEINGYSSTPGTKTLTAIYSGHTATFTVEVLAVSIEENLKYLIQDEQVVIVGCIGNPAHVVVPATIENLPVTRIDYEAFSGCANLTAITIPASIIRIGDGAFADCDNFTDIYYVGPAEGKESIDVSAVGNMAWDTAVWHYDACSFGGEHTYSGACDRDCNVCGQRRVAPHIYDSDCDDECNLCGALRDVPDHMYDNACDADCNVCGRVREVAEHIYNNACDAECNECGEMREVADHVYDNVCDSNCNECGAERVAPHAYQAVVTAPDCTNGGYTTYTCLACGDRYVADQTDAAGHRYNRVVVSPDCLNGGYTKYTCSVCNHSYTTNATAMLGHNYVSVVVAPDCVNNGYTRHTCSRCGDWYITDETVALGHTYDHRCDVGCNVCGAVRQPEGHVFIDVCDMDCDVCGFVRVAPHDYDNACDSECGVCGMRRRVPHDYDNACDADCNECGFVREVSAHTYSNSCDQDCNECGFVRTAHHRFADDFDVDCNECGAIREVAVPISFGGNSIREDVSALAFRFNVVVQGMEHDHFVAIYDKATIKGYKLLSMGAIVTNGDETLDIPVIYLYHSSEDAASFVVRIVAIPAFAYGVDITATPYIVLEINGVTTTIYGEAQTCSYNDVKI